MPALRGRLLANQPLGRTHLVPRRRPGAGLVHAGGRERSRRISCAICRPKFRSPSSALGSNLIVRDGGVPGVVVRLGRGFNEVAVDGHRRPRRRGGARRARWRARRRRPASPDCHSCAAFPARIGGALRMNGGAYGGETKDVLVEARGVDRAGGNARTYSNAEMGFSYRHCGVARRRHLHQALFRGRPATPAGSPPRWTRSPRAREATPADQEPHRRLDLQEPARRTRPGN